MEKRLSNHTNKRLISRIYKELKQVSSKKTNNLILSQTQALNINYLKEDRQMADRNIKKY